MPTKPIVKYETQNIGRETIGKFAYHQLQKSDLLNIAETILEDQDLSLEQQQHLARNVSLPMLGELVRLKRLSGHWPEAITVRPLICLALGRLLEQYTVKKTSRWGKDALTKILAKADFDSHLYLMVDTWHGGFRIRDLMAVVRHLTQEFKSTVSLKLIGPSTNDIQHLVDLSLKKPNYRNYIRATLCKLKSNGIMKLSGGIDLPIHREAVSLGLTVTINQLITSPFQDSELTVESDMESDWVENFCRDINFIKHQILPLGECKTWSPWSTSILNSQAHTTAPSGLHVLRCIALGRLLLPSIQNIRSPWTLFGEKIASVALSFGANDLGFCAIDNGTAKMLGLARMSQTSHLIGRSIGFTSATL